MDVGANSGCVPQNDAMTSPTAEQLQESPTQSDGETTSPIQSSTSVSSPQRATTLEDVLLSLNHNHTLDNYPEPQTRAASLLATECETGKNSSSIISYLYQNPLALNSILECLVIPDAQEYLLRVLVQVSLHEEHSIRQNGGIPLILPFLSSPLPSTAFITLHILRNLSRHYLNTQIIFQYGGVQAVFSKVADEVQDIAALATEVLSLLSMEHKKIQELIVSLNAVEVMFTVLPAPIFQPHAISLLSNLVRCSAGMKYFNITHVGHLLKLLVRDEVYPPNSNSQPQNVRCQIDTLEILARLVSIPAVEHFLVESHAIELLTNYLEPVPVENFDTFYWNLEITEKVFGILLKLSNKASNRDILLQRHGSMRLLLSIVTLSDTFGKVSQMAATLLWGILNAETKVLDVIGIEGFVKLHTYVPKLGTTNRLLAVRFVAPIAESEKLREQLLAAHGISVVVTMLESVFTEVLEPATKVLAQVTQNSDGCAALAAADPSFGQLKSILSSCAEETILGNVIETLRHLAVAPEGVSPVGQGVIQQLARIVVVGPPTLKDACLGVILALMGTPECQVELMESGGLGPVIEALSSDNPETQIKAIEICSKACNHPVVRGGLESFGLVQELKTLRMHSNVLMPKSPVVPPLMQLIASWKSSSQSTGTAAAAPNPAPGSSTTTGWAKCTADVSNEKLVRMVKLENVSKMTKEKLFKLLGEAFCYVGSGVKNVSQGETPIKTMKEIQDAIEHSRGEVISLNVELIPVEDDAEEEIYSVDDVTLLQMLTKEELMILLVKLLQDSKTTLLQMVIDNLPERAATLPKTKVRRPRTHASPTQFQLRLLSELKQYHDDPTILKLKHVDTENLLKKRTEERERRTRANMLADLLATYKKKPRKRVVTDIAVIRGSALYSRDKAAWEVVVRGVVSQCTGMGPLLLYLSRLRARECAFAAARSFVPDRTCRELCDSLLSVGFSVRIRDILLTFADVRGREFESVIRSSCGDSPNIENGQDESDLLVRDMVRLLEFVDNPVSTRMQQQVQQQQQEQQKKEHKHHHKHGKHDSDKTNQQPLTQAVTTSPTTPDTTSKPSPTPPKTGWIAASKPRSMAIPSPAVVHPSTKLVLTTPSDQNSSTSETSQPQEAPEPTPNPPPTTTTQNSTQSTAPRVSTAAALRPTSTATTNTSTRASKTPSRASAKPDPVITPNQIFSCITSNDLPGVIKVISANPIDFTKIYSPPSPVGKHGPLDPLLFASMHGSTNIVRYLIEKMGMDVNRGDTQGWRPIHWASANGHVDLLRYLIIAPQVNLTLKEFLGRDCLRMAVEKHQEECKRLLYGVMPSRAPTLHLFAPGEPTGKGVCQYCNESLGVFNKKAEVCQVCKLIVHKKCVSAAKDNLVCAKTSPDKVTRDAWEGMYV
ncbi:hypothetical protein Pelo_1408 [Pelomyxa schiedti]|nr:hypothetical protein Pelo_1408 [Pelomyxa schiedti]